MRTRGDPGRVIDLNATVAYQAWPAIAASEYDVSLRRIAAAAGDQQPARTGLSTALREICVLGDFALGHIVLERTCGGRLLRVARAGHLFRNAGAPPRVPRSKSDHGSAGVVAVR